jgi:hypothetical protein
MLTKEEKIELLDIEIERLGDMSEDLVDKGNFDWGSESCPVCIKAKIFAEKYNKPALVYLPDRCLICNSTEIGSRCDRINKAQAGYFYEDNRLPADGVVFFRNLFDEFIIRAEEDIVRLEYR